MMTHSGILAWRIPGATTPPAWENVQDSVDRVRRLTGWSQQTEPLFLILKVGKVFSPHRLGRLQMRPASCSEKGNTQACSREPRRPVWAVGAQSLVGRCMAGAGPADASPGSAHGGPSFLKVEPG